MSLDGFLTFLALAFAIFAVTPTTVRLRVTLNIKGQFFLAMLSLGLVVYLEFFDLLQQPCPTSLYRTCQWITFTSVSPITPEQAAFITVISWMLMAVAYAKLSKVSANTLTKLADLVELLIYEKRFSEVISVSKPHLELIKETAQRKRPLQRLHAWANPTHEDLVLEVIALEGHKQRTDSTFSSMEIRGKIGWIVRILPTQHKAEEAAKEILRVLYRTEDFRHFIEEFAPQFAIDLLHLDVFEKSDFSDEYFQALILDTGSVLYEEIRGNLNNSYSGGYEFPAHNRILNFLFFDAKNAEQLAVYRPIGEAVLRKLRPDDNKEYIIYLNQNSNDFDNEQWVDPTYVGILFFDLMVSAAAFQGIAWHMWLHYLTYITEHLAENYSTTDPHVDPTAEFPTRSARLIYDVICAVGGWVIRRDDPDRVAHEAVAKVCE